MKNKVMDPDRVACFPRIQGGEGATGEDDHEVGRLEWIPELEEHD